MLRKIALSDSFVLKTLLVTMLLVMFLFYIDEGYYNFNWMREAGAWLVFFIYWNFFFWPTIGIAFLTKFLSRK